MNYNGIECPVCANKFMDYDDVVVCPICGTPHHRSCWNENGRCINEEKHVEGFVWQMHNVETMPVGKTSEHTMKICPRCGENNESFEPVCTRCGERLKANRQTVADRMAPVNQPVYNNWQNEINPNTFSPYQNVYATDARTVFGEDAKIEDIAVTEIAEYIQKDSTKYIKSFIEMQEKETKFSWNWASALGSVFWCFYRKMSGLGALMLSIFLSVSLIAGFAVPVIGKAVNPAAYDEYLSIVTELNDELTESIENGETTVSANYVQLWMKLMKSPLLIASYIIQIAAMLIISVVLGFLGNNFYKKRILKDIRTLRQVSVNSVSYHMYLRQRGGVSPINLLLPIMLYFMFSMFTSYL